MTFIFMVSFASSLCRVPFHLFRITCVDTHFDMRNVPTILDVWFREQLKMFLLSMLFMPLGMAYLALLNWEFDYYRICIHFIIAHMLCC